MFSFFSEHEFMPCELFRLVHSEIAGFEDELASYLSTPEGRFHTWYAERDRRRAA